MLFLVLSGTGLSITVVIVALALFGIGLGLFQSPNYSSAMGGASKEKLGSAGGVYNAFFTMGYVMGISLADAAMGTLDTSGASAYHNPKFIMAADNAYVIGLAVIAIAFAACVFMLVRKRSERGSDGLLASR